MQALSAGQSVFTKHSGRQFGGEPMYCGKHVQEARSLIFLHSEYNPHGDG